MESRQQPKFFRFYNHKSPLKALLVMLVFSASASLSSGQTDLSLAQAHEYALKNAASVKTAKYDAEVAQLQTEELIGIGLPQISGSIQYQNFITLATQVVDGSFFGAPGQELRLQFGTPHNMTLGLSASQLLFDGSWLVGLQASKAYAELQRKNLSKSEIEIKLQVSQAYHLALVGAKRVELLNQTKAVLSQMLDETKKFYDAGYVEEQDVDQLQLSLNEIENGIVQAETGVRLYKEVLKFTIGMPLQEEINLTDKSEDLIIAGDPAGATYAAENSIDVQLTQNGLVMQELNLKNQKAKFLPNAGLFYNLQSQALRQEFNFFDTSKPWFAPQLWGFQINVPILSGGSKMKSVQKAKVEVQRMKDMLEVAKNGASLEYSKAKLEYDVAISNYDNAQKSLALAQKILDKTNIKYKEGVSSSMDVSISTNQVLSAQQTLANALQSLMDAQAKLKKALNTL